MLSGRAGSLAASLDYAVSKEPGWMADMFGVEGTGLLHLRRFIRRSNTGGRHPGPVGISLSRSFVDDTEFEIIQDGEELKSGELLVLAERLEVKSQPREVKRGLRVA
jgi:hypothetical protein